MWLQANLIYLLFSYVCMHIRKRKAMIVHTCLL